MFVQGGAPAGARGNETGNAYRRQMCVNLDCRANGSPFVAASEEVALRAAASSAVERTANLAAIPVVCAAVARHRQVDARLPDGHNGHRKHK